MVDLKREEVHNFYVSSEPARTITKTDWSKWSLITINMGEHPETFKDWLWFIWGFDIWCKKIPLLKVWFVILLIIALL